MARILAIDYGGKRTGLATTDNSQLIVSPLETVDTTKLTPFVKNYLQTNNVERIIIGHSINLDGTENPIAVQAKLFGNNLQKLFPNIPIEYYNEQYTSKMATAAMVAGGFKKKYRQDKGNTDKMAAAYILQGWIDENKS